VVGWRGRRESRRCAVALHAEGEEEGREGVGVGSASGEGEVKGGGGVRHAAT
jgi:hypothetical protein